MSTLCMRAMTTTFLRYCIISVSDVLPRIWFNKLALLPVVTTSGHTAQRPSSSTLSLFIREKTWCRYKSEKVIQIMKSVVIPTIRWFSSFAGPLRWSGELDDGIRLLHWRTTMHGVTLLVFVGTCWKFPLNHCNVVICRLSNLLARVHTAFFIL